MPHDVALITTPDALRAKRMLAAALVLDPAIHTLARSYCEHVAALLRRGQAHAVFQSAQELAASMAHHVLGLRRSTVPVALA